MVAQRMVRSDNGDQTNMNRANQRVGTANARNGPAIPNGAFPFDGAFSSRNTACALVRAWLTSDVRQNRKY